MKSTLPGLLALLAGCAVAAPPAAAPRTLLQRIAGEWTYEADATVAPEQPPLKLKGAESGRLVGAWAVLDGRGESPGGPFTSVFTLGEAGGRYTATFISSLSAEMSRFEGRAEGNVITLETEANGARFRQEIELVDDGLKIYRSLVFMDGRWIPFLTARYRRN